MDLRSYIDALPKREGVDPVQETADKLSISRVYMLQLLARTEGRVPSPERCVRIEKILPGVKRWDLRPKDWHLIWPELIGMAGAPDVPAGPEGGEA